ncbi:MAG: hypothetical protein HY262_09575 [Chloroflexi bacterium]|nr:hypothetical protein [Chloroflexota bacterium]
MATTPRAGSDPAIALRLAASDDAVVAYQARTRVLGTDELDPTTACLRASIADSSRARALLSHRLQDGTIPLNAYAKFQGPHWTLVCLAQIDYPPGDPGLLPLKRQMDAYLSDRAHLKPPRTTVYPDQPERVRRCASQEGNAIWSALRLGLEDERTADWVDRLVAFQWPDGGWNCDKRPEARTSSFQETAIPARALHAYAVRAGHPSAQLAADRAAELLLSRRLVWRRRDGAVIRPDWGRPADRIQYPIRFYDVLYALEVMAELGRLDDPRCAEALDLLEAKRLPDGGFPLEDRVGSTRSIVASRATFADWGPSGTTRTNPLVTVAALGILRLAGRLPRAGLPA